MVGSGPVHPLSQEKTNRLENELQVHRLELERQNEELRLARAEVEAGLQKYYELYDFAPIGYCTVDGNGLVRESNLAGALLLGLVSGLVVSQCATPVLAVILTYVMAQQSGVGYGAALLFLYALGCAVPVVLAGSFAGALKRLRHFGRWNERINQVSGALLIAVGLYFLWVA